MRTFRNFFFSGASEARSHRLHHNATRGRRIWRAARVYRGVRRRDASLAPGRSFSRFCSGPGVCPRGSGPAGGPRPRRDVISEGCAGRGRGRGRRAPRRREARARARAPRGAVDVQQDQPAEGRVPRLPGRGRRPRRRRARARARGDPSAHARVRLGQSRGVRARARRRARTRRARYPRRNHPTLVSRHVPRARQGARRSRRARRER